MNPAERAIDHDLATFWSGEGDGQWIQANLPDQRPVDGVSLAWNQGSQRVYDFDILVSTNGTDWTTALSSSRTTRSPRCVRIVGTVLWEQVMFATGEVDVTHTNIRVRGEGLIRKATKSMAGTMASEAGTARPSF